MARPLHLYVHVPFCARTCPYCHFYNIGHDDGREALFLDGLAREIAAWESRGSFAGARLVTLYWGGGTPSLLSIEGVERLGALCLGVAPAGERLEWTLEANPGDVWPARLDAWRAAGVTRLSVGVQSFDDRRLEFLGRNHTGAEAREALERAAAAGFDALSLDLMFNLAVAGRRRAWAEDLRLALSLPIVHLSLYGLTLEPGTPFDVRGRAGETLTVPDSAYAAEYRAACRVARRSGFDHYEVSSFARRGHRARHNAAYWTGSPYLGLGPSAHSFDGTRRWANVSSLRAWAEALATGGDPRAFVEEPGPSGRALETLYLGLRTRRGVPADHPLLTAPAARRTVEALVADRLCGWRRGRLACTERGFLVLDAILDRLTTGAREARTAGGGLKTRLPAGSFS